MGGSIRKDFSARVTHLVSNCCGGEKYRVAVSMGTHIMSEEWVHRCWQMRDTVQITANDEELVSCCTIYCKGYPIGKFRGGLG